MTIKKNQRYHLVRAFNSQHLFLLESDFVIFFAQVIDCVLQHSSRHLLIAIIMPTTTLPSKPGAEIAYELLSGDTASSLLVVCLNGLGLAQSVWEPAIKIFQQSNISPKPWILTYDRYGQGASARDPREAWPEKDAGYAHTLDDVTDDLYELIQTLCAECSSRIVFVNNSIGAHIARRYADR